MHIDLPERLYYSIGQVAKAFNVNASLIRFWEKEFPKMIKPEKNAKGNRLFTKEDIAKIEVIYHLVKEKGHTLEGAKTYLKSHGKENLSDFDIIRKLEKVKAALLELKSQL